MLFDDSRFGYGIWEWEQICILNARPCLEVCDKHECKVNFLGMLQIFESKHIHQLLSPLAALNLDLQRHGSCNKGILHPHKHPHKKIPT